MMTTISSMDLMLVQGTNGSGTTQNPAPATNKDVDRAARDFSDAIRNRVQQRIDAARLEQAVRQGVAAGVQGGVQGDNAPVLAPVPPVPALPPNPRVVTIHSPDGNTSITIPPRAFDDTIPPQAVDISIAFFITIAAIIIGLPLARAFARRMDRRGPAQVPAEISSQLQHLNQAVDAIALEVERISEGQRFTTRLLSEQKEAAHQPLASGTGR